AGYRSGRVRYRRLPGVVGCQVLSPGKLRDDRLQLFAQQPLVHVARKRAPVLERSIKIKFKSLTLLWQKCDWPVAYGASTMRALVWRGSCEVTKDGLAVCLRPPRRHTSL